MNRTLTWKLDHDLSLYDSKKIHQDIQQPVDDWARYTELSFRQASVGEKTDFNLTFVSGDHSDGAPFDGLEGQEQDGIQALHEKKKNPVTSLRPSRRARSITTKHPKATKKQKTTKKKKKKATTKKPKINNPNGYPIIFHASDQAAIVKAIKELQFDGTLTAFKNLSETIKIATDMLPKKLIPILQTLSAAYSRSTKTIQVYFDDVCAILSKFVIKSYHVIQYGMHKDDKKVLTDFEKQLNTDIINRFEAFVEPLRSELSEIFHQLLINAYGGRITSMLKEKDVLEADLLRRSEQLTKSKKSLLEREYKQLNDSYNEVKKRFDAVVQEIGEIYKSVGTADIRSINMVDELARAVLSGQESIVLACSKVRIYLRQIDADKDFLVTSTISALKIMNMADAYMDTTRIQNVKQVLALE